MEPKEPRKTPERPDTRGKGEPVREPSRDETPPADVPGGTQRGQEQGFNPPIVEADREEARGEYDRDAGVSPPEEDIMTARERPDEDEVFAPGEIVPQPVGMSPQRMGVEPVRVANITPGEDFEAVEDEGPPLHTEPLHGRVAGVEEADARLDFPPTMRNVSGGHARRVTDMAYNGPERRRRQEDWSRWSVEDRRQRAFTYGDRRTL